MRVYEKRKQRRKPLTELQENWIRGLNTLVSATQIKPNELAEATDIQLVEDGKIQCPRNGQTYWGSSSGSKVTGLFPYYMADGTRELLRTSGTALQVYNTSTSGWDTVSGKTYTTTLDTEAVIAYDRLYLANGTDRLTYYDGTDITTFTEISAPTISDVARTGTTGTYTYSYKVTAITDVGETTPSAADSEVANVDELDDSTYMTVTWGSVTSAVGYNIYGRKDGKWYFLKYLEGNGSTTYVDKGNDQPQELFIPPEGNSTGGALGKYIALYKDSLFLAGDPNNPSRLYYSGGGDKIHDFTVESGGGFIDVSKNDGQKITGLKGFKNTLVVFKDESIYQFSFNASTGFPQIEQVNPSVGCISSRSIVAVENDVFFASSRGIFSLGHEAGFAFDILRTNEISSKVRSIFQSIESSRLTNIAAMYVTTGNTNLVVFSYTPAGGTYNSEALVYDRERLAWVKWTNVQANCWAKYTDSTGEAYFLYGDDNSGYVKQVLSGSDDFGSSIRGNFKLKAEEFKSGITNYKKLKDFSIVLREPRGSANLSIIVDGTSTQYQSGISTVSPTINWGYYTFKDFLFGVSQGSGAVTTTDDIILRTKKNLNIEGRNYQLAMNNGSSGASFTLLAAELMAKPRSGRYRKSEDIIS